MENSLVQRMGNVNLYLIQGDITQTPTDAVMTTINSGGLWFGGVDGVINRVAGNHYHAQASERMPLKNLDTVIAKGNGDSHIGQFNDVVFVVDDLESPLNEVVYKGLEAAHNEGYQSLALPAMRMGVMAGVYEKTPEETVSRLREGILQFIADYGEKTKLEILTLVVYRDPDSIEFLERGLKELPERQ